MKCFSDGRKYMKKWTLTEFFWKSKLAFFGLSDGTNFKILRRFFGFLLFFGRKTPPNSAELVLKKWPVSKKKKKEKEEERKKKSSSTLVKDPKLRYQFCRIFSRDF